MLKSEIRPFVLLATIYIYKELKKLKIIPIVISMDHHLIVLLGHPFTLVQRLCHVRRVRKCLNSLDFLLWVRRLR